jgi:NitT/TauT family transport system substrate-binding protein
VAHERGYFEDHGLEVTMVPFEAGKLAADALLEGEVDYATSADFVFARAVSHGQDVTALASMARANVNYLVARGDRGIAEVADLAGRKVGVTLGSQAEFYLARMLQAHGLTTADVQIVNMTPGEMTEAIVDGRADAVLVWEPYVQQMRQALGDKALVWPAQADQAFYWLLLTAQYEEPEARALLGALADAEDWMLGHPTRARAVVAGHVDKPGEFIARMGCSWPWRTRRAGC